MVERDGGEAKVAMKEPWQEGGGEEEEKAAKDIDEREEKERKDDWSEIRVAIEELSLINHGDDKLGSLPTLPFLALSHLLLQVLDKIGPTMAVLRLDVQRNIERLQELYLMDPSKYSTLTEMVEKEVRQGAARQADSCARAVLWLTRSMDFTVTLLQRLEEDPDELNLAQLVEAAYSAALKPWHGWISSAAYKIALKLVPERHVFVSSLVVKGQDCTILKNEIEKLVLLLQPFLDDIHAMVAKFKLDRLKST